MGDQQLDEISEKISESIEKINKWLEKTNKSLKYNSIDHQQLYKNYEKTPDLIKRIDEWLETNKSLEDHIKELERLLDKMTKYIKEKATDIFDIGKYTISIELNCNKRDDGSIWCKYDTEIHIYNFHNEDEEIECYSYTKRTSYKIECSHRNTRFLDTNHKPFTYKSFKLSNSPQSIYFLESTKKKILDIHGALYPGVLKNLGDQDIHISVGVLMDLKKSIKKNPEIIKEDFYNLFEYNDGRYDIEIDWHYDNPSKS